MLGLSDNHFFIRSCHGIAVHSLEAALKIAPLEDMKKKIKESLAAVYNNYANFLLDMSKCDEAEEFFEKSLEIDPGRTFLN